jgi:hypothetical protein
MIYSKINCPYEGSYGQMYFQVCQNTGKVFLICSECERMFSSPEDLEFEIDCPLKDSMSIRDFSKIIPELGCSMQETRPATKEEIINYGWEKYLING